MLHILLLILKIIGILILAVLGLLLLAVLLVLFVPLRYQITGSYYGAPKGKARVTWLLHLLSITAAYEGEPKIEVRLAGFRLFGPKKERKLGRRALKKGKKATKKLPQKAEKTAKELPQAVEKTAEELPRETERAAKELPQQVEKTAKELPQDEKRAAESPAGEEKACQLPAPASEDKTCQPPAPTSEEKTCPTSAQDDEGSSCQRSASAESDAGPQTKQGTESKKSPGLGERLRSWWRHILEKPKNLWCTIKKICVRIRETKDSVNEYRELLASPEFKRAWKLVKKEARRLLRHLKPKKFTLTWRFGFEDPAVTGEVLAWLAMFYGFYYKHVTLIPVFDGDSTIQEGEFYCRGRIRAATLLIILAKLYFNKDIRLIRQKLEKEDEPDRETK